ncbi:MAG: glycosyl hydrolase [Parafilimonas sp.]
MKFLVISIIFIAVFFVCNINAAGQAEWQKKYKDQKEIEEMFAEPPIFYAPHAFWFWNDTIKDENLAASMAEEMIKQRLNPGYAHPRSSMDRLNPKYPSLPYEQYLKKPWFNSFGNALKKAKDNGFTLGYCDEYDWPSGQAAGLVLKQHPELEAKYLDFKRLEVKANSTVEYDSVDFAVAAKLINQKIDASSLLLIGEGKNIKWTVPAGNWIVYTYTKKHHPGIDGGKVNYLNPELMKVFIPIVHEQYAKHFGNDMGKSIPGVFVDNEGDYGWQMAWSEYLAGRYKEMKGRDIRLWLPLLSEKDNAGLYVKARCDWFEVISDVYNTCYFVPIVEWLKKHNMYYISNLWEESLLLQAQAMGDFMQVTRTATMPGTDCLLMKSQDVHDFKEVQTVAELEGRPFMSEIMGVAGWEQTPAMIKMTVNSITSYGVNHIVPHGINVNRKLETNPYPADWFTENPYWPYLHYWTDFSRRASFVTRQTKLVADVLLINPQESIWANADRMFSEEASINEINAVWNKQSFQIDQVYSDAMRQMNENNIDFLIGDKHYLMMGQSQLINNHSCFTIKDHHFLAMVLPPVTIISHGALDKILEFAKQDGVVIILGETPKGSPENGANDKAVIQKIIELKKQRNVVDISTEKNNLPKMVAVLNQKLKPQMLFENSGRLYTSHRKIGAADFYWLANNSDSIRSFSAWFKDGSGAAEIWNCETGNVIPVVSVKDKEYNKVTLSLQPYEAYWVVFNPDEKRQIETPSDKKPNKEIVLNQRWTISYPGVDTIYRTSAKAFFSDDKIIQEEKMKSGLNDTAWKFNSFITASLQKTIWQKETANNTEDTSSYIYWRVVVPVGANRIIFPENMLGTPIWMDGNKSIVTANQIDLVSDVHLLSFAFKTGDKKIPSSPLKFIITNKTQQPLQNWYNYGLEQYTGYVDYETTITKNNKESQVLLDLGKVKFMAEVFVNGKSVGARLWPSFTFNLTKELKKGDNKIRIRVGNLMVNEMWMKDDMDELRTWGWVGTPDFEKYNAGLTGPVKLLITE